MLTPVFKYVTVYKNLVTLFAKILTRFLEKALPKF